MIKENPLAVKSLCHVSDATKYLVVLHAAKVIEGKEPTRVNRLGLPIIQLFLRVLVTYLLDVQSSVSFHTHKVEGSLLRVLFHSKHTNIIFGIVHDMIHKLTHDAGLTHTCTRGERHKLSCPDAIGLVVHTGPRVGTSLVVCLIIQATAKVSKVDNTCRCKGTCAPPCLSKLLTLTCLQILIGILEFKVHDLTLVRLKQFSNSLCCILALLIIVKAQNNSIELVKVFK